jgi:hypothetical protein
LSLETLRREGFEDGVGNSETEPLFMDDSEQVAYQAGRRRGEQAAEGIRRRIARELERRGR